MPVYYEIRVQGHLDEDWSEWFEDLGVSHEANGETVLSGWIRDQAALHGVLGKVRDLGINLISLNELAQQGRDDRSSDTPGAA